MKKVLPDRGGIILLIAFRFSPSITVYTWVIESGLNLGSLIWVELGFCSQDNFVSSIYSCSVLDSDSVYTKMFALLLSLYSFYCGYIFTKKTYGTLIVRNIARRPRSLRFNAVQEEESNF